LIGRCSVCLITIGLYASNANLFPLARVFLTARQLATGIAWVNSVGIRAARVAPREGVSAALTGGKLCGAFTRLRVCCAGGHVRKRSACERHREVSAPEPLAAAAAG